MVTGTGSFNLSESHMGKATSSSGNHPRPTQSFREVADEPLEAASMTTELERRTEARFQNYGYSFQRDQESEACTQDWACHHFIMQGWLGEGLIRPHPSLLEWV